MKWWRRGAALAALAALAATIAAAGAARAQLLDDILLAPKTLIDRAIEARSGDDIYKDNRIVVAVNAIMADLGDISASTEIYEQRLLITGIFNDLEAYERFLSKIETVEGVKALYWHAIYMPAEDEERQKAEGGMLSWGDVLAMKAKAEGRLIGTAGVADVNFRLAVDSYATVYLLGRARSEEERAKAVARLREGEGVKRVIDYVEVRP